MITVLIIQIALGAMFFVVGAMKVFMQDKARTKMKALQKYPQSFVTFIGVAEIAGALGITLPVWLNIYPSLAVYAVGGLSLIMLGAIYTHITRKEYPQLILAALFLAVLLYLGESFL